MGVELGNEDAGELELGEEEEEEEEAGCAMGW